jgi:beta-galactosidase
MDIRRFTDRLGGLAFGGDYNPEQWDAEVWGGRTTR